jgi:hypothetical protein
MGNWLKPSGRQYRKNNQSPIHFKEGDEIMNSQKHMPTVSGGVFLIGLGILVYTGWWWPAILLVIGLASSAELILRGKYVSALVTFGFFAAIPLLVSADIPWHIMGPFILIAMGAAAIFRSVTQSDRNDKKPVE